MCNFGEGNEASAHTRIETEGQATPGTRVTTQLWESNPGRPKTRSTIVAALKPCTTEAHEAHCVRCGLRVSDIYPIQKRTPSSCANIYICCSTQATTDSPMDRGVPWRTILRIAATTSTTRFNVNLQSRDSEIGRGGLRGKNHQGMKGEGGSEGEKGSRPRAGDARTCVPT